MLNRLAIVVPCYNEEEVLRDTNVALIKLLNDLIERGVIAENSYVLYVDDGSKDATWKIIEELFEQEKLVQGLKLAGNKGHQNALYAGLMAAKEAADVTISIDADLQDDVTVIEAMLNKYALGNDIVYGVRNDRSTDSFFKRLTAEGFYRFMNLMGAKTVFNSADFRLMSKRALEELALYSEDHLFLRGIVPELGFKSDCVYYKRSPRLKGESKYPFGKMLSFAFNGITSFSVRPLTFIMYLGFAAIMIAFVAVIYSVVRHFQGQTIQGWTSLFVSIWFLGGVQLVCLGVIGQYVGKTFVEAKKRPRYYIEHHLSRDHQ